MNEISIIIHQFILEGGKLHTLPELYQQLEEKIHASNSSIEEISDVLSTDTALSVKILKLANSALYGFRAEVTTLKRALNLIGLNDLKNLILMDTIANKFSSNDNCAKIKMEDFWRRSVYTALIAKRLAKKNKHEEPERLFISAIMSRLGQLVCCATCLNKVSAIIDEHISLPEKSEFDIELRHLGFCYNQVSGALLQHWHVPENIINSICYLHAPISAPQTYQQDSSILNVATIYSGILELDEVSEHTDENNELIIETADTYLHKTNPAINHNLHINQSVVEDILFEIEMDALEILQIIFPRSSLIF